MAENKEPHEDVDDAQQSKHVVINKKSTFKALLF